MAIFQGSDKDQTVISGHDETLYTQPPIYTPLSNQQKNFLHWVSCQQKHEKRVAPRILLLT